MKYKKSCIRKNLQRIFLPTEIQLSTWGGWLGIALELKRLVLLLLILHSLQLLLLSFNLSECCGADLVPCRLLWHQFHHFNLHDLEQKQKMQEAEHFKFMILLNMQEKSRLWSCNQTCSCVRPLSALFLFTANPPGSVSLLLHASKHRIQDFGKGEDI